MGESESGLNISPRKSKVKKSEALWLVTFSDLSFILLCFFVLMFSYSSPDTQKFDHVRDGMQAKAPPLNPTEEPRQNLKVLEKEIQQIITENRLQEIAEVTFDAAGVAVEFKDHALFDTGSARINPGNEKLVRQVLQAIASTPSRYRLEVEGHTDDLPIRTRRFRDNWELSSSRAISLVRRFRSEGVDATRLSVMAYAETRPKVALTDKKGKALQAARAQNRRVVIRIR